MHYLSGKLKKVYLLSADLPVAGDFVVFLGLVGYVLGYVIAKASIHDAQEAKELILSPRPEGHFILGDEGYIGK